MLFSCLVDADFLDTESFMNEAKSQQRQGYATLENLEAAFNRYMEDKNAALVQKGISQDSINILRADVLYQCRQKAQKLPGAFTLTVPTGGGKTLSSMAFALRHAAIHGKRRIIYAIPYTSIIEQTANIYREIFGDGNLVQHHSNIESDPEKENYRSRLASENWDAPIIVTTNVQLFESLFARKTSRCRKLHNLVNSVIVLDEAQLLPVEFLQPIMDVLRLLIEQYAVTVIFCTATQPALTAQTSWDPRKSLRGLKPEQVTEIIDNVPELYAKLKRVAVSKPQDFSQKITWEEIAARMLSHSAVLTIVNSRADAKELYNLLRRESPLGLFHLSALMCPQHRSDEIKKIKESLVSYYLTINEGKIPTPIRVVSTQLIEAGVDLDFPVVFRALAGLDSIAQAAGRCNREGNLDVGHVYVFAPPKLPPPGLLRKAAQHSEKIWYGVENEDALSLDLFPKYFQSLYGSNELDEKKICDMLRWQCDQKLGEIAVNFRDAAEAFRLINDEDSSTVIVHYSSQHNKTNIEAITGKIEKDGPNRFLMRQLQRFGVSIYESDITRLLSQGDIRIVEGCPGLYVQNSSVFYDKDTGVNIKEVLADPNSFYF